MSLATTFSAKSAAKTSVLVIKQRARYRWPAILVNAGINSIYLQNKHGPCPTCDGVDRFRFDDRTGNGDYFCNQCGSGDGISLLMKVHGWTAQEALQAVSQWLDMERTWV
jgi:putative DNA primase/helicase